ncbi:ST14 transmembrane serine protease matriptase a isoform X2 [Sander lucioperca]|uniref:ST14 transmembrane serine protease matriptase a isoform X2 n=1 Tax=Sander lucioperca TaxID=283035 RepID=UPI00125D75FC|nr:ST14 transmembrane serine protease matriptase a isoform X2 [Sander lucioperca]
MDYMDSGLRYTPKPDKDWDTSVQFLPASDNQKLEKKKGPGRVGAVIAVVVFAAVIALITGLLVWHFHFRDNVRLKRMYSGSMRITNQVFESAYENSTTSEFKALAQQVISQLKSIYSKSPQLNKYYVGSTVQAFSEGSVIAYYLSEFKVPADQQASVDSAMSSMEKLVDKERRTLPKPGNSLVLEDVMSSAIDSRMLSTQFSKSFRFSVRTKSNQIGQIQSPGFPDSPYSPNTFSEWQLRADPNFVIKLVFDTIKLEADCKNDFVKIYDSLVAIESRVMQQLCGQYSHTSQLTFLSSGNVMLVTMATNDKLNYPGFRAQVSQIRRGSPGTTCGGQLLGEKGDFSSPSFPNYYPPKTSCQWSIQVPAGKGVKVNFKKFLLAEPGWKDRRDCPKDYVEINGKKLCGENPDAIVTETSNSNTMSVVFFSDASYVDRGFSASYMAIDATDPCPDKFQCRNQRCIKSELRCDGWNDCGDMSDELTCTCSSTDISCGNGFCKPTFWKCDGVDDCGDGTDELNCAERPGVGPAVSCTDLTYKCNNNVCISKVNPECDGTQDCQDGSDEQNCDCGSTMFKTSRIVGGQDADAGEFPWQVSLHVKGFSHVCGATIISQRWLVTAAHCVQDDAKTRYSQPGTWEVYLGLHNQQTVGSAVVKRNLKQIIPHPNYNHYTFDNDIALMELDSPVTYSDYIKPICLPAPQHDFPVGSTVWITGWGATREGGFAAKVLQKAQVRIINQAVCNDLMGGDITSRMLCAGVLTGGIDACQGDSGGPLSSPSSRGMFLAGVVSWGDGCARRNKPGIYTAVTKFRGFIKEKTGV